MYLTDDKGERVPGKLDLIFLVWLDITAAWLSTAKPHTHVGQFQGQDSTLDRWTAAIKASRDPTYTLHQNCFPANTRILDESPLWQVLFDGSVTVNQVPCVLVLGYGFKLDLGRVERLILLDLEELVLWQW